ncbi:hypothetical protein NSK_007149 [Nannochloropsis salina CCMP1776]|uniref:Uncharacterized protein n=1 Tax=Nannochloropsis salina CCMP1776 TaxID=1027361 RepID=A0A4D9CVI1_9STRA|nr:hypothetical protein NSK_007149 [Nannochloropsis salina CCMP1776]|eukprot:TFJ81525.1 hypothetical protein NSK_007149 [Nannochloropsis salina CCMP1776]
MPMTSTSSSLPSSASSSFQPSEELRVMRKDPNGRCSTADNTEGRRAKCAEEGREGGREGGREEESTSTPWPSPFPPMGT